MGALSPVLRGEFSVADLLREAAERSIDVNHIAEPAPHIDTPSMSGTIIAEEVQPGLLLSGFDLTYTAYCRLDVEIERSIACAILLDGEGEPMELDGHPPIIHEPGRVVVLGCGESRICTRPWHAGQRARVFGLTLKPSFFDRFGRLVDDDGMAALQRFLEPGVHCATLPWAGDMVDLANGALSAPYGGSLRALFRESQALRFLLRTASLLSEEERVVREVGRKQYDRARQARELLDQALVDPPKLFDLGRQLGINVSTLQANFKAAFGTTIFGYVRDRRLEIGRALILEHGLGVAEAGYKVGFSNAAAFTAAYRRQFGRPPSAEFARAPRGRSVQPPAPQHRS